MNLRITPVLVPLFGLCDTVAVQMSADNLTDSAQFAFALGRLTQGPVPPPRAAIVNGVIEEIQDPAPAPVFTASPVSGQLGITGTEYAQWSGDNETVAMFVEASLPTLSFL